MKLASWGDFLSENISNKIYISIAQAPNFKISRIKSKSKAVKNNRKSKKNGHFFWVLVEHYTYKPYYQGLCEHKKKPFIPPKTLTIQKAQGH